MNQLLVCPIEGLPILVVLLALLQLKKWHAGVLSMRICLCRHRQPGVSSEVGADHVHQGVFMASSRVHAGVYLVPLCPGACLTCVRGKKSVRFNI